MTVNLFFDDEHIFVREGFERCYGEPEEVASFSQPGVGVGGGVSVWKQDGKYHMFLNGWPDDGGLCDILTLTLQSEDGIHLCERPTAEEAGIEKPLFANQMLPKFDGEVSLVIEDPHACPEERLKAFLTIYHREENRAENRYLVSGDGVHFHECEHSLWRWKGAEPGMGGVYRPETDDFAFIVRPDWGVRQLYSVTTSDFKTWSPLQHAVTPDSEDAPLAESYGMPIFRYKGFYLGFLWLYYPPQGPGTKYLGGKVNCQLAYSMDARIWKRALRRPFIGNVPGTYSEGMVYPSAVIPQEDGSLIILAHACKGEHGDFNGGAHAIVSYRLREDGFIRLCCEKGRFCSSYLWMQGETDISLSCKHATCACLDMKGNPLPGLSHEDCIPFEGDSAHWVPQYSSGQHWPLHQPVMLEICMENGSLYAISGEFENLTSREAARRERA